MLLKITEMKLQTKTMIKNFPKWICFIFSFTLVAWLIYLRTFNTTYSNDNISKRQTEQISPSYSDPITQKWKHEARIHSIIGSNDGANITTEKLDKTIIHNTTTQYCRNTEHCRFLENMKQWPNTKPKGAIYYLTHSRRIPLLKASLHSVDKFYNDKFKYPIIIFHEAEFLPHIPQIRTLTTSDLYFQEVKFEIPLFLKGKVKKDISCLSEISYRHMCRFHIREVYKNPIIELLDWYFRLDDDSLLTSQLDYDVFEFMEKRGYLYGYLWKHWDALSCTEGLWPATNQFIKDHNIKPYFLTKWPSPRLYYNNFEITSLKIWKSQTYREYADYIDKLGGIYYHRWGDAPVHGLAVAMLVPENQTHHFEDVGYRHGTFKHPMVGQ